MKIRAKTIVEMMGAPEEYIVKTLKDFVQDKIKTNKDLEVLNEDYETPEKKDNMFSVFVELDIIFNDMTTLLGFCFDALPSSFDIIEPLDLKIHSKVFSEFINDFQARLHEIEMVVKTVRAQNKILDSNAMSVLRNFVGFMIEEPKTIEEMSKHIGMDEKKLQPFVNVLLDEGKIKKEGDKYSKP